MWTLFVDWCAETLVPLAAAAVLGGVVGWERESQQKPAGVRTNMLVAVGTASFMHLVLEITEQLSGRPSVELDPTRLVQGVVQGIGFLGAGVILRREGELQGVTTGAAVWTVGAIGAACGAKEYGIAIAASLLALVALWLVRRVVHTPHPDN